MFTHHDLLTAWASSFGNRTALTGDDGRSLSYHELEEGTSYVARALLDRGFVAGNRLAWLDHNSLDFLIAYFATARVGMTMSGLNNWLRPVELRSVLERLEPSCIVVGDAFLQTADDALGESAVRPTLFARTDAPGPSWDQWSSVWGSKPLESPVERDENLIHEIVFTSGTTGEVKGVMRTQRSRIVDAFAGAAAYGFTPDDHLLWFLPQFHVGGAGGPLQLMVLGGRVTVMTKFDPAKVAKAIETGVTYLWGVPTHYLMLLQSEELSGTDLSAIRACYVGGGPISQATYELIRTNFPNAELVAGFGSTESGPHSLALRSKRIPPPGALGFATPGVELSVLTADGGLAPQGDPGELWVRSDAVASGYLGDEVLTRQTFVDGWLRTGDLVRQNADGSFVLVGRVKDVVISGGENIYPNEVETAIQSYEGVLEAVVLGVPDAIYGERLVAFVLVDPSGPSVSSEDLGRCLRNRLAGFKVPKELHLVTELPRTANGKISRELLRTRYLGNRRS